MPRTHHLLPFRASALVAMGLVLGLLGACASSGQKAADGLPDVTEEGLVRVENAKVAAAYRAPDADLGQYARFYIADVEVEFRKNWLRDQNRDVVATGRRITKEDADRIRTVVAEEFRRIFAEELRKAGYEVLETDEVSGDAHDVLALVPAIVNLDITAPDVMTPGISRTYTASAGSMTLYMEFRDAVTGALLGKVADTQAVRDRGYVTISNSVTNKAEADRMFRRWATLLVGALDRAHGKG